LGERGDARVRRDVEDEPALLRLEDRREDVATVDHAHQVDAQDPVPVLERDLADLAGHGDAGVVHEEVDAAERAPDRLRHRLDVGDLTDVDAHRHRATAGGFDEARRLLGALEVDVGDEHPAAALGQGEADGAAEAAAAAGHDGTGEFGELHQFATAAIAASRLAFHASTAGVLGIWFG